MTANQRSINDLLYIIVITSSFPIRLIFVEIEQLQNSNPISPQFPKLPLDQVTQVSEVII